MCEAVQPLPARYVAWNILGANADAQAIVEIAAEAASCR
jgi:hypothetical protein